MRMFDSIHRRWPVGGLGVMVLLAFSVTVPLSADVMTLTDAFSAASPGSGYDTMLVLDPANTYTGGLVLPAGNHCIVGNGATINLQSGSISAGDGVVLDVSGCSIVNGNNGVSFTGGALGNIECCNFYGNYNGLYVWDTSSVTVVSCNFVNSDHYGVYREEHAIVYNAFNNAWNNADNDYVYYCPG